jgi:hypothetical protein
MDASRNKGTIGKVMISPSSQATSNLQLWWIYLSELVPVGQHHGQRALIYLDRPFSHSYGNK